MARSIPKPQQRAQIMMDAGTFLFILQAGGTVVEPGAVEPLPGTPSGDCLLEVWITPKGNVEGCDPTGESGEDRRILIMIEHRAGRSIVVRNPTTINEETMAELAELIHGL